jgi:solute carrier family 41
MGFAVNTYADIAVFQPVINGVGGNLVAIFASRLSTVLHVTSTQGTRAAWSPIKWYSYPYDTFFAKKSNSILKYILIYNNLKFYLFRSRI